MGAQLRCEDVRFAYAQASFAFDCDLAAGEIAALMGPSGSGKSTLLSLIAGFETPAAGRVLIGGQDVTRFNPAQRPVSMVFQENNLFGHLDIGANVGLGLSPALKLNAMERAAVSEALERVGLAGMQHRLPRQLSGGERQRIALARVLLRDRPVLLLDEPFASLGPALRSDMLTLLRDLHRERGMTVLIATHHPDDARAIADRLLFVEDGRIAAAGDTDLFFGPDAPRPFVEYIGNRPPR